MADTRTPAQQLREAAKRIRSDAAWPAEEFHHAIADWLEKRAADYERMTRDLPRVLVAATARTDHALKVAHAYLGESTEESSTDG